MKKEKSNYKILNPLPKCCATCSCYNLTDFECMEGIYFDKDTESYEYAGISVDLMGICDNYEKGIPYQF
jgi:hypothetical protein